ncbi:MAG: DUF1353 domain-containing protein [Rhodobacteraceae bacterium]|nr:DUF1353 domain-containing protein [Paracoccaceae bacterium]MCW9041758.1 DUF1353 domain-containing protein [Pseudopelagicola sp.]
MKASPDTSWCRKGGSRGYVTTCEITWAIGKKESGWVLCIPVGREFESSVPRSMRWLWSPEDPFFLKSAVIHDLLLEEGFRPAFADSQWFEAALSVHAPELRTWLAYGFMRSRRFLFWSALKLRASLP